MHCVKNVCEVLWQFSKEVKSTNQPIVLFSFQLINGCFLTDPIPQFVLVIRCVDSFVFYVFLHRSDPSYEAYAVFILKSR